MNKNTPNTFLENIQQDVERHLNVQKFLGQIPVLSHRQCELESCLEELVQTGIGLSVVVLNPLPTRVTPLLDSIAFEEMKIRVQIIESPCTNILNDNALGIAESVSKTLHQYQPKVPHWQGWLEMSPTDPWKEIKDPQNFNRYIIELNFIAKGSVQAKAA